MPESVGEGDEVDFYWQEGFYHDVHAGIPDGFGLCCIIIGLSEENYRRGGVGLALMNFCSERLPRHAGQLERHENDVVGFFLSAPERAVRSLFAIGLIKHGLQRPHDATAGGDIRSHDEQACGWVIRTRQSQPAGIQGGDQIQGGGNDVPRGRCPVVGMNQNFLDQHFQGGAQLVGPRQLRRAHIQREGV